MKYLGLIVDDTLTWEKHIEYISTKINRNIGILKGTQNFLPKSSLITLYKTLIERFFRYCNIVWGQCNETLKDKLQSLQNKAVRTIAGQSYEYTNHNRLLKEFGWLSVRNLINLDMGVFMYKTQNGMAPEEFNQLFVPAGNIHGCLTRSAQNGNLQLPKIKLKCAQGSISYSGAKLWNSIPPVIRKAESIVSFKEKYKDHLALVQFAWLWPCLCQVLSMVLIEVGLCYTAVRGQKFGSCSMFRHPEIRIPVWKYCMITFLSSFFCYIFPCDFLDYTYFSKILVRGLFFLCVDIYI